MMQLPHFPEKEGYRLQQRFPVFSSGAKITYEMIKEPSKSALCLVIKG
jgi:hypothetical protein